MPSVLIAIVEPAVLFKLPVLGSRALSFIIGFTHPLNLGVARAKTGRPWTKPRNLTTRKVLGLALSGGRKLR